MIIAGVIVGILALVALIAGGLLWLRNKALEASD